MHVPMQGTVWPFKESYILWGVIRYDISTTIMPGLFFALAAWHTPIGVQQSFPFIVFKAVLYFLLYCLVFCLSNQIAGVEEDRHNKPERPLPQGLLSLKGAWVRWIVAMVLFTLVGWWLNVLVWTILWQVLLVLYNFGHWSRHYVTKNSVMCGGLIAQLAAAWQLVTPLTPQAWAWILVPALVMLTHVSLQDLRDVVGDRANQRRTFPLVVGWDRSRWFLAIAFAILPLITHGVLFAPAGLHGAAVLCSSVLTGLCLVISWRLLRYTEPAAHHRTYMLFTYWYCALLASAIIIL